MRQGVVAVVASLVASCEASQPPAVQPSANELRTASTTLSAESGTWSLEAEAWRSFQPITTASGDPMIVVARLRGTVAPPPDFGVRDVYLVRGDSVWSGAATEEHQREPGSTLVEVVVRNAPRWGPGDSLDVIARVGRASGSSALLRAPRILIARVD
jgi:hypothetical protein